jgi:GNAT superfamily N-acetyltransferase
MLRRATPEDAEPMRALVRAAYAHYVTRIGLEPLPMLDDYGARVAAAQAWVWAGSDGLSGVLVLEDDPSGLLLDNIAVASHAQGRGLGRAMIAFAEEEARRRGHPRLWLYTNEKMTENIAIYTRLGFRETHRDERKGRKAVYMEKPL